MKLKKKVFIGCASALMCLSLAACGGKSVATSNAGKITQEQFYNRLKKTPQGKSMLASMISDKLLKKDYGKYVSAKQVDQNFNAEKAQPGFAQQMQQQGITSAGQIKNDIQDQLLLRQAVKHHTHFTDAMLKKQFKHYEPTVKTAMIICDSESQANAAESKLQSGSSFSSVVQKYSQDSSTKKHNGKVVGFNNTSSVIPKKIRTAAFKLSNGKYNKTPVKTKGGYVIIKMLNKPAKGTWKDHINDLKNQITDKKMKDPTVQKDIRAKVLRDGNVNIQDNSLKNALAPYMSAK